MAEEQKALSILVVEDDPTWQNNFKEILTDEGHTVEVAGSLQEALLSLKEQSYDLAIVDVRLDDSNERNIEGVKVLEELALPGRRTKAVVTTGYREQVGAYKDVFARCSVFDYFGKDETRYKEKLLSVVERIVASRGKLGLWEIEGQPISFETHRTLHRMLDQYLNCINGHLGQLLLDRGDDTLVVRVSTRDEEEGVFSVNVNGSISGLAFKTGNPVNIPDVTMPKWASLYKTRAQGMRSELAVPMHYGEKIIGVLNIESNEVNAFGERDQAEIMIFAEQTVMAIRNEQMLQGIIALQEISTEKFRQPIDLEGIWALILDRGLELVGGRYGNVLLVEGEELVVAMTRTGEAKPRRPETPQRIPIDDSITGWVVSKKEPILVNDVLTEEPYTSLYRELLGPGMRSELAVPIIVQDRVVGALNVESSKVGAFGEDEKALLVALADQAASTIFNVQQYEKAQTREQMVAVGAISGRLAHQLNSPLSTIKNGIRLLELTRSMDLDAFPELRASLEEIAKSAIETIGLVNEMRERASRHTKAVAMNIVELIQQALHMAQAEWPNDKRIELDAQYETATNLPPIVGTSLLADVFYDLITNAFEAMPQGGRLTISAEHLQDLRVVQVRVSDIGIGIPQSLLEEIFEPNFSGRAGNDSGVGHGMGLYWSRVYVRYLGGEIVPKSVLGQGTDMIVRLPVWESQGGVL